VKKVKVYFFNLLEKEKYAFVNEYFSCFLFGWIS